MTDLSALIARVKEATGASEELSITVLSALLSDSPIVAVEQSRINGAWCAYVEGYDGKRRLWNSPSPFRQMEGVTASIDAALALVERCLPGWTTDVHTSDASPETYPIRKTIEIYGDGSCGVTLAYQHPKIEAREIGEGSHESSLPLAIIDALLTALNKPGDDQ